MKHRKKDQRRQKLQQIGKSLEDHQLAAKQTEPPDDETAIPLPSKKDDLKARQRARQSLVEQKIQQAMNEGAFDNLPGQGKPLNLKKNPYADPTKALAFDLLQNNQLAPEWIERDKAIRRELQAAREVLQVAWPVREAEPARWDKAVTDFTERLQKLNCKIDDLNLIVPVLSMQRGRLRLEDELRRLET